MDEIRLLTEEAVRKAGRFLTGAGLNANEIIQKSGTGNFVTVIDYKVQDFLVKELSVIIPGSNIITEESDRNLYRLEGAVWILDPVDGTTNLMYDYRMSAVSLALYIDGEPALGLVYNPYADEMFAGVCGKGAFLNGRPVKVSDRDEFSGCLIGFGTTPYDRSEASRTFSIAERIFLNCREIRRSGVAALDLAYVACGRLDGFFELRLQPWDYAAGIIIVKEAGGRVTNWQGKAVDILALDSVAASNGLVHEQLMRYF